MNFVVSLIQILLAAALHLSTVKTASINKGGEKSKNDVIQFLNVYNKSMCQPREVLVDIFQEYPDDIEHTYVPSCVVLNRCGGCCNDEAQECVPTETRNITLEVMRFRAMVSQHYIQLSFTEHRKCVCRRKPDVKAKKEEGKGQKRKRKKQRDTGRIAEAKAYASATVCLGVGTVSLLMVGLISEELFFCHCEPCSERRKRLFVQDPLTCKCSCKFTQLDCKSRQLELNERTCRCDKPRR